MASKALLEALRRTAVKRGDFTLASGKRSDYYINLKEAYTDPGVLRLITREMAGLLKEVEIDRIAGVAVGGVPTIVMVATPSCFRSSIGISAFSRTATR